MTHDSRDIVDCTDADVELSASDIEAARRRVLGLLSRAEPVSAPFTHCPFAGRHLLQRSVQRTDISDLYPEFETQH